MTISEKIFALLEQKELSQKEFSEKTRKNFQKKLKSPRVQSVTGNANGQIRLLTRY